MDLDDQTEDSTLETLRRMARDPLFWPDDATTVDLMILGYVERSDMQWHITELGEAFILRYA